MEWMNLIIAGLFEVVWAVGLKYTDNFSRLIPSLFTVIAMTLSFWFLSKALTTLPMGTAYAIWTGIGTLGTALFGMIYLGEPATTWRILSFFLLLMGMIGLKLF